jgi:iron complex transport system substrate-binding protein
MEDVMTKMRTVVALVVLLAACAGPSPADTTATPTDTTAGQAAAFPVTVTGTNGQVAIEAMPTSIVSLSPTATEMLFAVGAGEQVTAVDDYSYYPEEAPVTDLSGFTPNVEAIVAYDPDLVILSDDVDGVVGALEDLGVEVLQLLGREVVDMEDVYGHLRVIGAATGHREEAARVVARLQSDIDAALSAAGSAGEGLTYYHELDSTLYTVTSETFVGYLYGLFGLDNIADEVDRDGAAFGYPQLTQEYVLSADPDLIFVTDCCGDTPETVAARAGWGDLTAVADDSVVVVDDDIASRWGPRVVEMIGAISEAVSEVGAR